MRWKARPKEWVGHSPEKACGVGNGVSGRCHSLCQGLEVERGLARTRN